MATTKPLAERVLEALKKHGDSNLEELAKHTGSTAGSLSTMVAKVKGVRRVSRGVYGVGTTPPPKTAKRVAAGSFGTALTALRDERAGLVTQLGKLDRAIEAIEALA